MGRFLWRRALLALVVCVSVLTVSFTLTHLSGDVSVAIAGPNATARDIQMIREAFGLDRPLLVQFGDWLADIARGNLGRSYLYNASVADLIADRLPITLTLGIAGLAVALLTSLPLGILAALKEGSLLDRGIGLLSLVGQAVPTFFLSLLLIIGVGLKLKWFPISGAETWKGYVLPAFALGFSAVPALLRLTRSGMIDVLHSDYIRTARAKGLSSSSIVLKHALRNAAAPVVSIAAVQLGFMLGGSVVVESVFTLQGVGYLAWESISKNDFPVVQAVVLLLAITYVALTLIADLLNVLLDPRLRGS
jgi:peptide/nickel transport system permease protein